MIGWDCTKGCTRWLDDDAADVIIALKCLFEGIYVIRWTDDRRIEHMWQNTWGGSFEGRLDARDDLIMPAVEVPRELEQFFLARVGTREANGHQCCLSPGRGKPYPFR